VEREIFHVTKPLKKSITDWKHLFADVDGQMLPLASGVSPARVARSTGDMTEVPPGQELSGPLGSTFFASAIEPRCRNVS